MNSHHYFNELLRLRKGLISSVHQEFDKTNLEKVKYLWDLQKNTNLLFPETYHGNPINSISRNGTTFEKIGFRTWKKFNVLDLINILKFLEEFNKYLKSDIGPVPFNIARNFFIDTADVYDPSRYLYSILGDGIYFPNHKLKKEKLGIKRNLH